MTRRLSAVAVLGWGAGSMSPSCYPGARPAPDPLVPDLGVPARGRQRGLPLHQPPPGLPGAKRTPGLQGRAQGKRSQPQVPKRSCRAPGITRERGRDLTSEACSEGVTSSLCMDMYENNEKTVRKKRNMKN